MRVAARIFHPRPSPADGPLTRWLHDASRRLAERHAAAFAEAGADARIVPGPRPGQAFGARLREVVAEIRSADGLVVLGSGAVALASRADLARFVAAAGQPGCALANNRYSADIVAVGGLDALRSVPDLRTDNALPRWLEEAQGYRVAELRRGWRLGVDLDSPIDLILTGVDRVDAADGPTAGDLEPVRARLAAVAATADDPAAELLVSGRTSPAALAWLERRAACRVRALIEERGLRAGGDGTWARRRNGGPFPSARPPAVALGALLDRDGPAALGRLLAGLADAALLDTRVLLAHRLGRDERLWPGAEDRFASDLLLADRITDSWLREVTASALEAPIPVVLGGHTLVGPGLRLALGGGLAGA